MLSFKSTDHRLASSSKVNKGKVYFHLNGSLEIIVEDNGSLSEHLNRDSKGKDYVVKRDKIIEINSYFPITLEQKKKLDEKQLSSFLLNDVGENFEINFLKTKCADLFTKIKKEDAEKIMKNLKKIRHETYLSLSSEHINKQQSRNKASKAAKSYLRSIPHRKEANKLIYSCFISLGLESSKSHHKANKYTYSSHKLFIC